MTKIKLCGLSRPCDIDYVNELIPEYIGFVFWQKSKRYVSPERARELRDKLRKEIIPVGVFVDEKTEVIAELAYNGIIDIIQLHGSENDEYIEELRRKTNCPIIKAYLIRSEEDVREAKDSTADYVLLDSGLGTGRTFDHSLLKDISRPFFLAGGLTPENVGTAVKALKPFAVDASSSLETEGFKDKDKMTAFVKAVRKE